MIEGIAWSYPAPDEVYADPDVLRFSILQPGEPFKGKPASYWRQIEGSPELADHIAEAAGYRSQSLTGFTLFQHPGKGWQMSVRRERESGWDVGIIDDGKAKAVLALLENSGHPDGPWQVKSSNSLKAEAKVFDDNLEAQLDRFEEAVAYADGMAVLAAHRAAQARLTAALVGWCGE